MVKMMEFGNEIKNWEEEAAVTKLILTTPNFPQAPIPANINLCIKNDNLFKES